MIFEMLKSAERGLLAKPNDGYDDVFSRSLVIHEMADCPYSSHATIRMEHHGEFGVFTYAVVRSRQSRERSPWVDGSKLVTKDLAHTPPEPPPGQRPGGAGRAQRYR